MSYKDALIRANTVLAADPKVRFIGYGLQKGRALGTLKNVPDEQIIEMPVAENLMLGMAIGLSLTGLRPVVFIERMDFLMNCMDALVNHLDKIENISKGEFNPRVIIRCIVGNVTKPLYTGATHTQDFSNALRDMVDIPVYQLLDTKMIDAAYEIVDGYEESAILIEYKDLI
jgi:pyruvate/2-oxoglutarate/acetoin dehydrogenase E1 component